MNKAKELLLNRIKTLNHKATQKEREAEKLRKESEELAKELDKLI